MKFLKIMGIILAVILVLIIGLVLWAPSSVTIERSETINLTPKEAFRECNNFKLFNKWSPWYKMDPETEYFFDGSADGVGSKMTWYSDQKEVGNGMQEIIEAVPNEFIKTQLFFDWNENRDFGDEGESKSFAYFKFAPDGEGTKITWGFQNEGVTGTAKLVNLILENMLAPQYEKGLKNLKERANNKPNFTMKIELTDVSASTYLGTTIESGVDSEQISNAMGSAYGMLVVYMQKKGLKMSGYPLAVYNSIDENLLNATCGIPFDSPEQEITDLSDPFQVGTTYAGKVVKTVHKGDYKTLGDTHRQVKEFINYYGYKMGGNPWEDYPTDPTQEPDTSKWITNVYYPVIL